MSLPLKTVVDLVSAQPCEFCRDSTPHFEMHVFVGSMTGKCEPRCLRCLSDHVEGFEVTLEDLTPPPPSKRKVFRAQKRLSTKQEVAIAEELGGKVQKASGAMKHAKGDVRKKGVARIEAKFTQAESYSVKLDELYKIASECTHGEMPVLVIDFLEKGSGKQRDRFAVLHMNDLKEMLNASNPNS